MQGPDGGHASVQARRSLSYQATLAISLHRRPRTAPSHTIEVPFSLTSRYEATDITRVHRSDPSAPRAGSKCTRRALSPRQRWMASIRRETYPTAPSSSE